MSNKPKTMTEPSDAPKRWTWEEIKMRVESAHWDDVIEEAYRANEPYIDHLEAENMKLEKRIEELEEQKSGIIKTKHEVLLRDQETIAKLKEALEFYADLGYHGNDDQLGKRAREALKEDE